MTLKFIIAQLMGLCALIALIKSFQENNKETLLKYQIVSSFCYVLQYLFLNAYTGCLINLVCTIRNWIFSKYDKVPIIYLIVVIMLIILFAILTYSGIATIFPVISIMTYSIAIWTGNLRLTRKAEIISCLVLIIYNIIFKAYTGIITLSIEMIFVMCAIIKYDFVKYKMLEAPTKSIEKK